jgi:aromatic-L-amino-acid decarboxylase
MLPDAQARTSAYERVVELIERQWEEVASLPVAPQASYEQLDERVRAFDFDTPISLEPLLDACSDVLRDGIVHTSHPRYFGLFNPTPTFAGVLADALVAAFNPQLAVTSHAPAAVAIERRVLSFLASRLGLPDAVGTFTSGGAEANLTAVLVALERHFPEATEAGLAAVGAQPTLYASTEAHHSLLKVARMTGLGQNAVRSVPPTGHLALDVAALRARIVRDRAAGERAFLVVATAGSTAAGVIDPLPEIADLCEELDIDLHVDAAWGVGHACRRAFGPCSTASSAQTRSPSTLTSGSRRRWAPACSSHATGRPSARLPNDCELHAERGGLGSVSQ